MSRRPWWIVAVAALVAGTSACGTTVSPQQAAQATNGSAGLSAPTPGALGSPSAGVNGPVAGVPGTSGVAGPQASAPGGTTSTVGPGGGQVPVSAPGAGVEGPLKVGILDAKSPAAAAKATGAQNAAGVDPAELTRALIRYYNGHGGMAGRKLVPVEYTINPTSPSYENDLSSACARFTQDNHVQLVVSQTGNIFSANYESCLTKAGATNLEVGNGAPDDRSLKRYPHLYTTASPTVDRRTAAILRGLTQTGLLTHSTKVGVIVEACPENTSAYAHTVVPLARSLGLTLMRRDVDCVGGFSDAGNFFAQVGSAVLPFNTGGVSRVMFMTSFEVASLQAFENQAKAQHYSPSYALSSIAATAVQASQYTADAQHRMFGVGWVPVQDTSGVPQTAGAKRCAAMARSQGEQVNNQSDYVFLLQICDLFRVLDAALVAARGSDVAGTFAAGLAAAMRSFGSAFVLGGRLRLGGDAHDGPPVFAPFGYVASCSCFRYTSKPTALA
jgi:hypothetical protein